HFVSKEQAMPTKPIPDGHHTVTPYLLVQGVPKLIDFLKQAFAAEEIHRSALPNGTIRHAQVRIGDSMVMMGEAAGEWKPTPAMLYLYVPDSDAMYASAIKAGGKSI